MGWTTFKIQQTNIAPRIPVSEITKMGEVYTKYCKPHMKFETQASVLYNRTGQYKNRCLQFVKEAHELDLLVQKIMKGTAWLEKPKEEIGMMSGDTYVVISAATEGVHVTPPTGMTGLLDVCWFITTRDYFDIVVDPVFDITSAEQLKESHDFAVNRIIRSFNPDNKTKESKLESPTQDDFNFYIENI